MDFEEKLLKRYLENVEFVTRIRKEKGKLAMKVYYNGILYFDYTDNIFTLNKSVFIPNNTNRKNLSYDTIPQTVINDTEIIKGLNFKFTVGANDKDKSKGKKFSLKNNSTVKNNPSIITELEKELKKYYPNVYIKKEKNNYNFYIGKKENEIIKFKNLYNLLLTGYNICPSINFGVNMINTDISKLINDFNDSFNKLDDVMKRRINTYCSESKEHINDYNRTKSDNNTEKQYQQKLMQIIKDKDKTKNTELFTKIFKEKNITPFEMEYTMYSKEENQKNKKTPKGRIDNLFVKNDVLVMIELKMGTSVIGGTNGIHKHLLDLCTIFDNNKEILNEVGKIINNRDEILKNYEGTQKYIIGKNNNIKLKEKEYYIICGYDENKGITENMVRKKIDRLYNEKITSVEIFKTEEKSNLKQYSKTITDFHTTLEKYSPSLLELTIPEYIDILKNKHKCKVKIYLANQDYTIIKPY